MFNTKVMMMMMVTVMVKKGHLGDRLTMDLPVSHSP